MRTDLQILDKNFNRIYVLDSYQSLIWTERYAEYGDFELVTGPDIELLDYLKRDNYILFLESNKVMIIEEFSIDNNEEEGTTFVFKGRSLESILDRRVLILTTGMESASEMGTHSFIDKGDSINDFVTYHMNENIINPKVTDMTPDAQGRKIDNFVYTFFDQNDSVEYQPMTDMTSRVKVWTLDCDARDGVPDIEVLGRKTLYDLMVEICKGNGLGFMIKLSNTNKFVCSFYKGTDRSYTASISTSNIGKYVLFSPDFDNLSKTNYFESNSDWKNYIYAEGPLVFDEDGDFVYWFTGAGPFVNPDNAPIGLNRRESYILTKDIDSVKSISYDQDGKEIKNYKTPSEFKEELYEVAFQERYNHTQTVAFEGEVNPYGEFEYGRDFLLGDIVELRSRFGQTQSSRVTEVMFSVDRTGYVLYPTFEGIEEEV